MSSVCPILENFPNLNLGESDENRIQGYIARSMMADKVFSGVGNYKVVPDENGNSLLITERIEDDGQANHAYICRKCTDLTTFKNMRKVDMSEMKKQECIHGQLSEIVFENMNSKYKPIEEN